MLTSDITRLGLATGSFDAILCVHVLEHIEDDRLAICELYRVLKPGGFAVLQVPLDYERDKSYENPLIVSGRDRKKHFGQSDHVRVYGRDYLERLRRAGFRVSEERLAAEMSRAELEKYGINDQEIIYVGAKG
jgi:SAM-dependent methyltransferase